MDLESLRCFLAAADTASFRAAARRVALSPGAFSDRIRRLEQELEVSLFVRTTRKVALSEAGQRLVPHARALLRDAASCKDVAQGTGKPAPFSLTVGTRFELGLSWLCPALTPLSVARPERTLHLFMGDSPDLLARTERGDLDAVVFSARLTSPRLTYAVLHREEYVFVGASRCIESAEDAANVTLLDVSSDLPLFRYFIDALPDGTAWRFPRHQYLGGVGAIRFRVLEGAGVAVLPEYFVRGDLEAGRLVRLMPEVTPGRDTFRLVWRRGHPLQAELEALAGELRLIPLQ